jgi:thioredoxin reductase (NADPH)
MAIKNIAADLLIIGGGPAGLTAALYGARAGLKTVVLEGRGPSRLSIGYQIENYPGFLSIDSRELLDKFRKQAERFGAEIVSADVFDFSLSSDPKYAISRDTMVQAEAVILATGKPFIKERMIPGEENFLGMGVSYCATCDGPLYRGQTVAAWGDSEEAAEDVLALAQMGCKVTWIPGEKDALAAPPDLLEEVRAKNIPVLLRTKVKSIVGEKRLEKIILEKGGGEEPFQLSAFFIFREGLNSPLLLKAGLKLDHKQCLAVDRFQRTNLGGVFAAGDITCGGMQIITACGEGGLAAMQAIQYLRK